MNSKSALYPPEDLSALTKDEREGFLRAMEREKLELQERKEDLLKELQKVEENIAEAGHHYGRVHNFSYPAIVVIPDDILISVFEELQRMCRATGVVAKPVVEVTLTHVCRHWRCLALSSPSLWKLFMSDDPRTSFWHGLLDGLRAYIDRSQEVPLDLWVGFTGWIWEFEERRDMLDAIAPHLHRFRALHLSSDHFVPIHDFVQKLEHASLPMLERLAIRLDTHGEDRHNSALVQWDDNILLNGGAPSLRYLHLDAVCAHSYRPPLSALVHLRIEDQSGGARWLMSLGVHETFFSLPLLESLSFWGPISVPADREAYSHSRIVTAGRLKHCRFGTNDSLTLEYFLAYVVAPALETLTAVVGPDLVPRVRTRDADAFPSSHTLSLCVILSSYQNETSLASFTPFVALTKHIKRFVLTPPSIIPTPFAQLTSAITPPPNAIARAWSEVKEVTINASPYVLEPLPYPSFIHIFPNVETVRTHNGCRGHMLNDQLWTAARAELGFDIVEIPIGEILIPFHWSPGPNWMDIVKDPFIKAFSKASS